MVGERHGWPARSRRWGVWALGVVLLVGVPVAVRSLPAEDRDLSADELVALVRDAEDRPYSGLAETVGTLQLPTVDDFSGVAALFGESARLRVWWRGDDSWRVDRLLVSGEEDLVHDGDVTTSWEYEAARARISADPDVRLPRTADLLPPELAARALRGDVTTTRIEPRRVAGVDAVGLRVEPGSARSSVDHVLVWADPATGVALDVEVYGESSLPSFTSRFVDFSPETPAATTTTFEPPPRADVSFEETLDIADAANQYAPFVPPRTIGGLVKQPTSDGAVGVYGTGLAQVIAIPLRDDDADALREQMGRLPGAEELTESLDALGVVAQVDLLGIALTGGEGDGGYLVAGTVTPAVLAKAMSDLLLRTRYVEDGPS